MHPLLKELGHRLGRQLDRFNTFVETPKFIKAFVIVALIAVALVFLFRKPTEQVVAEAGLAEVQFESRPAGAKIYLLNKDTGKVTPATFSLDPKKPYPFVLSLDGYEPSEVYWGEGGETSTKISVDLQLMAPAEVEEQPVEE